MIDLIHHLDDGLFFAVNDFARRTGWLHTPVVAYTRYGVVLFGLLLLAGLLYARSRDSRTLAAAGWAGIAALLAVAINQPLSHFFHEVRPYGSHRNILLLVARSPDYSFPSDHAVMAGAVATGLLLVSRRWGIVAVAAAVLLALSRVYVGAHYPWDVLAGLMLGAGVAGSGWLFARLPLTAVASWTRSQPALRIPFNEIRQ